MSTTKPSLGSLIRATPPNVRHPLKVWPYTRRSIGQFVAAFVVMTMVFTLAGLAVTEWLEPSSIGEAEADVSLWLEEHRTASLTTAAEIASVPSNTPVKIGLVIVLAAAFPFVLRRWHDWAFLVGALLLEVCVYGLSSYLVGRPRPPVERLAEAPTQSFPSGHVAAAVTFYIGLVIIVHWHSTNGLVRRAATLMGAAIPLAMIASRLYLGMHYISDVIAGVILGVVSLLVALKIAQDGLRETAEKIDEMQPIHTLELDRTP